MLACVREVESKVRRSAASQNTALFELCGCWEAFHVMPSITVGQSNRNGWHFVELFGC